MVVRAGGVGEGDSGLHFIPTTSRNSSAQFRDERKLGIPVPQEHLCSEMRGL